MKTATKVSLILTGLLLGAYFLSDHPIVTIQSMESKTADGHPIFNRIKLIVQKDRDIWLMNQSHHGPAAPSEKWERLAIVINKSGSQKTASFYQLPPGKLEWSESLPFQKIEFRVSCFLCHSNGPRAIRPDTAASSLNLKDYLQIAAWNFRIKTYGKIQEAPEHEKWDRNLKTPFRFREEAANEALTVKSCTKCHGETGWLTRNKLTRQNQIAIRFMLEKKLMPPIGFSISEDDQRKIQEFLAGF